MCINTYEQNQRKQSADVINEQYKTFQEIIQKKKHTNLHSVTGLITALTT